MKAMNKILGKIRKVVQKVGNLITRPIRKRKEERQNAKITEATKILKNMKKDKFRPKVVSETEAILKDEKKSAAEKAKAVDYFNESDWVKEYKAGTAVYIPYDKYWAIVNILEEYQVPYPGAVLKAYLEKYSVLSDDYGTKDERILFADQVYDNFRDVGPNDEPTKDPDYDYWNDSFGHGVWGNPKPSNKKHFGGIK